MLPPATTRTGLPQVCPSMQKKLCRATCTSPPALYPSLPSIDGRITFNVKDYRMQLHESDQRVDSSTRSICYGPINRLSPTRCRQRQCGTSRCERTRGFQRWPRTDNVTGMNMFMSVAAVGLILYHRGTFGQAVEDVRGRCRFLNGVLISVL